MKKFAFAAAVAVACSAVPAQAQERFQAGEWVVGRWQGGDFYYPATVVADRGNSIEVEYDSGRRDTLTRNQVRAFRWSRGGRVECRYSDGEFYAATITSMSTDGVTLDVRYDDGETGQSQTKFCRSRVQN